MIVLDFIERFKPLGLFSWADIDIIFPGLHKRRLYEWCNKGYIVKLRNNWYCLPEFLKENYSTWSIANLTHAPSYISLESALNYYNLIPEGVYSNTSICTNRPLSISMAKSHFVFSNVKTELYFGYSLIKMKNYNHKIRIAEPEKALLDFFYIRHEYQDEKEIGELRFNSLEMVPDFNEEKLISYLRLYKNKELEKRVHKFLNMNLHA